MTTSSPPPARRTSKTAMYHVGALVAVSVCCALLSAVASWMAYSTGHTEAAGPLLLLDGGPYTFDGATDFITRCTASGSLEADTLVGAMWIIAISFGGRRRQMTTIFERAGALLTALAITGIACGVCWFVVAYGTDFYVSSLIQIFAAVIVAFGGGAVLGLAGGVLTVVALAAGVLARTLAGFLRSASTSARPAAANGSADGDGDVPRPIRAAAALMPPEYARRWLDDIAEALFDYSADQHSELLRDFLLHSPAAIIFAWTVTMQRHLLGSIQSRGNRK